MSRSPHPSGPWARLLREVLDDDARTRRADVLLSHLTTWVLVVGVILTVAALLLLAVPWWVPTSAGGVGAIAIGGAWARRRWQLHRSAPAQHRQDEDPAGGADSGTTEQA